LDFPEGFTMPEYNFQLRGWHALVGVALLIGFFGVKMYLRIRPVDDAMRDAVREELLKEYSGRGPKDVARLVTQARQGSPVDPLPPLVQHDVEFNSIQVRGAMGGPVTLVRAEVAVDGGPPPDGRSIRYFSIGRKFTGGWMVMGESNAYRYFQELMP
jgi:hypothetical protein